MKKLIDTRSPTWLSRNALQVCQGGFLHLGIHRATVRSETSILQERRVREFLLSDRGTQAYHAPWQDLAMMLGNQAPTPKAPQSTIPIVRQAVSFNGLFPESLGAGHSLRLRIEAPERNQFVRQDGRSMPLPGFQGGEFQVGIHPATLAEVVERLGSGTARRRAVAARLERICAIARATGQMARCVVFGSFVTAKPEPNDVDVFLLMEDTFDCAKLTGEAALLFDHLAAEAHFGASIFWLRRAAAFGGEESAVEYWQVKRDGGRRGIVEIVREET